MTVKVFNQNDMAQTFDKYGAPNEIGSAGESYIPYGTETENELFDEAMNMLIGSVRRGLTEGVRLIY